MEQNQHSNFLSGKQRTRKILFLSPYPKGKAASQRLKYEQYFDFFEANGFETETSSFVDDDFWEIIYKKGFWLRKVLGTLRGYLRRCNDLFRLYQYDIVYIHLWVTPLGPPVFEWITRKLSKKIVYDIDDMVYLNNSSGRFIDKIKGNRKPIALMKSANHVIVCSPFLEEFVRQYNSKVTTILASYDTQKSKPKQHVNKDVTTIGWTGTHSTLKYLNIVADVLAEISKIRSIEFLVICNQPFEHEGIPVRNIMWSAENELQDLAQVDIGLYPLAKEEWVLGKSGNKALAYMNLGIPCIATNFGTNTLVIENKINGFLVDTPEEWKEFIVFLLDHPEERARIGALGRQAVENKFSLESNKAKYLQALQND